jgi:hypothetical protein
MDKQVYLSSFALITLLSSQNLLAVEVFKWVDEKGHVHYEEKKTVPGAKAMQLKPAPKRDTQLEQRIRKRERLLEVYEEERDGRKTQALKLAEEKKARVEKCQQAQETLTTYEQASRIYTDDANGNQVNLSDAQRSRTLKDARAQVKKYCS